MIVEIINHQTSIMSNVETMKEFYIMIVNGSNSIYIMIKYGLEHPRHHHYLFHVLVGENELHTRDGLLEDNDEIRVYMLVRSESYINSGFVRVISIAKILHGEGEVLV